MMAGFYSFSVGYFKLHTPAHLMLLMKPSAKY